MLRSTHELGESAQRSETSTADVPKCQVKIRLWPKAEAVAQFRATSIDDRCTRDVEAKICTANSSISTSSVHGWPP